MDTAHFTGQAVLSIPAENALGFLQRVFACWDDGRLFAITRDPAVLEDLDLPVESLPPLDAAIGGWGRFSHRPRLSDDPAQIVFSSGTEGRPKAILLSHRNLADVVNGVVCGRGRNPTLRLWPAIFSGEIDVFPSERRNMGQEIGR